MFGPEPPNRDGVICPEGFDDTIKFTVIETTTRREAQKICRPLVAPYHYDQIRGCVVDFGIGGRLVVYPKNNESVKAEELAHAACPSLGYDSLALDMKQQQSVDFARQFGFESSL